MKIVEPAVLAAASDNTLPYETALLHVLPGRVEQLLLTACLGEGEGATHAWRSFAAAVGDPKGYFEDDQSGLKGLLPLVGSSLMRNGIDAGRIFQTYARVALVREELRGRICGEILSSVLDALTAAGVATVLLKGAALSATVYPQPSARHNHAIDLLVDDAQLNAADDLLKELQFAASPRGAGAASHRNYRHWTGLALGLHTQPFYLPNFEIPRNEILARAHSVRIGATTARVMSPEDSLVHICGHATYSRSRANLRWACDAFYLLKRNPGLDWPQIVRCAEEARVALQLYVLLRWLKDSLGISIPETALAHLRNRSRGLDFVAAEGILASLVHTHMSWTRALECCRGERRMVVDFLKFGALPSPRYLRWRYNSERNWRLPIYYLRRPVEFGMNFLRLKLVRVARFAVAGLNPLAKEDVTG